MRIIKTCVQAQWEQNYKKEEFISGIIEQILMICKFDKNFDTCDKSLINEDIKNIQKKIKNKDELLVKTCEIRKSLIEKMTELENENLKIKINLFESLGIEL